MKANKPHPSFTCDHVIYYSYSCVALHKMIEDDKTEQFKVTYSHLLNHYQDLATRWLDLETCTLLYRYGLC